MAKLTNKTGGYRGFNAVSGYVELAPGATSDDVELSPAERKSAESTGYFTFDGEAAPADDADQGDGLDGKTVAELEALLGDRLAGVTGTGNGGRVVKADLVAALRAPAPAPTDTLDDMTDETLRETVQAITGTAPPAEATRDELLALARG